MAESDLAGLLSERAWIAANAPQLTVTLRALDRFIAFAKARQNPTVHGTAVVRRVINDPASAPHGLAEATVQKGEIAYGPLVRVMRGGAEVYLGHKRVIRNGRDSFDRVPAGQSCLVQLAEFDGLMAGDIIESVTFAEV